MQSSIKYRLFRSFALLVALPVMAVVLSISLFFYINTQQTIKHQGDAIVSEIAVSITDQLTHYESLIHFIEQDQMVVQYAAYASDLAVPNGEREKLIRLLQAYAVSIEGIDHIGIQYQNGLCANTALDRHPMTGLMESDWYKAALLEPRRQLVFSYPPNQNPMLTGEPHYTSSVQIVKALTDQQNQPVGVVSITVQGGYFSQFLTAAYRQQGGQSYLSSQDGHLINSSLKIEDIAIMSNRNYHVTRYLIPETPFEIINILPVLPYRNSQVALITLTILASFAFMLVFFAHARYTSQQFVRPIEDLRNLMHKAESGNLQVAFQPHTGDEFEDLAESFNRMVVEIRELIHQVYVEQSSKRKAEIAALQANIKPHFLYNTLETIHWMARRRNANEIVEAVDALSDLFRVGFSSNHELGTVALECTHVESYLKIQKLRYADILDYKLIIDPAVSELPMQKTVLQPIVENALYHGIKESGHAGKIMISAGLSEGDLVVNIQDNGIGLSPEALERVRAMLQKPLDPDQQHGSGMANVHQRLHLSYGPGYGLTVDSRLNIGTVVTLRHPVISLEGENKHEI